MNKEDLFNTIQTARKVMRNFLAENSEYSGYINLSKNQTGIDVVIKINHDNLSPNDTTLLSDLILELIEIFSQLKMYLRVEKHEGKQTFIYHFG